MVLELHGEIAEDHEAGDGYELGQAVTVRVAVDRQVPYAIIEDFEAFRSWAFDAADDGEITITFDGSAVPPITLPLTLIWTPAEPLAVHERHRGRAPLPARAPRLRPRQGRARAGRLLGLRLHRRPCSSLRRPATASRPARFARRRARPAGRPRVDEGQLDERRQSDVRAPGARGAGREHGRLGPGSPRQPRRRPQALANVAILANQGTILANQAPIDAKVELLIERLVKKP